MPFISSADGGHGGVLDEVGEGPRDQGAQDADTGHQLLGLRLVTVHQVEEAEPEQGGDPRHQGGEHRPEVDRVVDPSNQLDEPGDEDEPDEAGDQHELAADQDSGSAERPPRPTHSEILRCRRLARRFGAF
jgi:hypothetical protein